MYSEYDLSSYDMCRPEQNKTSFLEFVKEPMGFAIIFVLFLCVTITSYMFFKTSQVAVEVSYVAEVENVRFYSVSHKDKNFILATNFQTFQFVKVN